MTLFGALYPRVMRAGEKWVTRARNPAPHQSSFPVNNGVIHFNIYPVRGEGGIDGLGGAEVRGADRVLYREL